MGSSLICRGTRWLDGWVLSCSQSGAWRGRVGPVRMAMGVGSWVLWLASC